MSTSTGHAPSFSQDLVTKYKPVVLKRRITEVGLIQEDYKKYDNIRVICRFRPTNRAEKAWSERNNRADEAPQYTSKQTILLRPRVPTNEKDKNRHSTQLREFTLDRVLPPTTTQKEIFYAIGQPMILSCLEGFNSTIFAYGQSGSGKTYTMMGPEDGADIKSLGLIPRCLIYLFQRLNNAKLQNYVVTMELLQIYKSEILDLLNPNTKAKLEIKTDFQTDSIFVKHLRSVAVTTIEEAFATLSEAQSNRIVSGHSLNAVSSRSHMLVMIKIVQTSIDGTTKISKLNFGDLAGSEDIKKALGPKPDPNRLKEAQAINQSLSALTACINSLVKGRKPSFRDSPLTHILKDSLGGNSKSIMFVACSPHVYNRNETIRALRFAQTAKKVKNKAKKNEELSVEKLKQKIKELEAKVTLLQAQLTSEKGQKKVLHRRVTRMKLNKSPLLSMPPNPENISMDSKSFSLGLSIDEEETRTPKKVSFADPISPSLEKAVTFRAEDTVDVDKDFEMEDLMQCLPDVAEEEEDLKYIQQISDLNKKLEDEMARNEELNKKIDDKNKQLDDCNAQIQELMAKTMCVIDEDTGNESSDSEQNEDFDVEKEDEEKAETLDIDPRLTKHASMESICFDSPALMQYCSDINQLQANLTPVLDVIEEDPFEDGIKDEKNTIHERSSVFNLMRLSNLHVGMSVTRELFHRLPGFYVEYYK